jgi:hypothetical protein|eukprot:SAG25_NODE_1326_length_3285_cov_1.715945_3_plen_83_part_00
MYVSTDVSWADVESSCTVLPPRRNISRGVFAENDDFVVLRAPILLEASAVDSAGVSKSARSCCSLRCMSRLSPATRAVWSAR